MSDEWLKPLMDEAEAAPSNQCSCVACRSDRQSLFQRAYLAGEAAAAQRAERAEGALREISSELPCETPCDMRRPKMCGACGHIPHRNWCAGCVARAALTPSAGTGGGTP